MVHCHDSAPQPKGHADLIARGQRNLDENTSVAAHLVNIHDPVSEYRPSKQGIEVRLCGIKQIEWTSISREKEWRKCILV